MNAKKSLEQVREQQRVKTGLYNRYLLLRYSLAIFFFANLNWAIVHIVAASWLALLPIILIIVAIPALYEQVKLYSTPSQNLKFSKFYFKVQWVAQLLFVALCFSSLFKLVFPLFTDYWQTRLLIGTVLLLATSIIYWNLQRIAQIERNTDRFYQTIQHIYSTNL